MIMIIRLEFYVTEAADPQNRFYGHVLCISYNIAVIHMQSLSPVILENNQDIDWGRKKVHCTVISEGINTCVITYPLVQLQNDVSTAVAVLMGL